MNTPNEEATDRIVFFDGECGICSFSIRFLTKMDNKGILRYAPLQGETAHALLDPTLINRDELSTIVYLNFEDDTYLRSDAVLVALRDIGWPAKAFSVFRILPQSFRDWLYDWFAQNRHNFSKKLKCRLLTADERKRILP